MSSIRTMEYYSAVTKKEILTHTTTWMSLENIILREISQTQKVKYHTIPFTYSAWLANSQRHKIKWCVSGAGEMGGRVVSV